MMIRSKRVSKFWVLGACVLAIGAVAFAQPGTDKPDGTPGWVPDFGQRPGEGRGGRGERASVEAGMKLMNRSLDLLKRQVDDKAKTAENLQLIADAQRGCLAAKAGKLDGRALRGAKTEDEKAALGKKYRVSLLALTRTLLDVEASLLDGKLDEAKAGMDKAFAQEKSGHEEFHVGD